MLTKIIASVLRTNDHYLDTAANTLYMPRPLRRNPMSTEHLNIGL